MKINQYSYSEVCVIGAGRRVGECSGRKEKGLSTHSPQVLITASSPSLFSPSSEASQPASLSRLSAEPRPHLSSTAALNLWMWLAKVFTLPAPLFC